jgi:1-deoxy-D-xylulose-5-phosphate reductoisomerase
VAVQAFLDRRIGFRDIDRVVRRVMDEEAHGAASSIEAVLAQDAHARQAAGRIVDSLART